MKDQRTVLNQQTFFALLQAGLWERDAHLFPNSPCDYEYVERLAEEQSVMGLVARGLLNVVDSVVPKNVMSQVVEQALQLEQRNSAMNYFISVIVDKMREMGINSVLVKGQGIANCYEKPLWRACGDVDLLLDAENYEKAKTFLIPLAASVEEEDNLVKHLGMTIDPWVVELHGTLRGGISKRFDKIVDEVQSDTFINEHVRVWENGGTSIFLPSPDNDAVFVFAHFVDHFFRGGIGLRQICDWCRLLWTYRSEINRPLLAQRISDMGLTSEWKAFAAYAVDYLGMPVDAMPMYDDGRRWKRKARQINSFILEVGNFGHNRDNSFYEKYPYLVYKIISFWRHLGDFFRHLVTFPGNSINVFCRTISVGVRAIFKGA